MLRLIMMSLVGASLLGCNTNPAPNQEQEQESLSVSQEVVLPDSAWVRMQNLTSHLTYDMRYAQKNNFLDTILYDCDDCLLRNVVAKAILKADSIANLQGLSLTLFDCYRPLSVQQKMFHLLPNPHYVADPKKGSNHNRGCAVDLTLSKKGIPLDMAADFDDFTSKAHWNAKGLNAEQITNRNLLKKIMNQAGFKSYQYEWWHYTYKNHSFNLSNHKFSCP